MSTWSAAASGAGGGGEEGGNVIAWLAGKTSKEPKKQESKGAIAWLASQTAQGKLTVEDPSKTKTTTGGDKKSSGSSSIPQPRSAGASSGSTLPVPRSQKSASNANAGQATAPAPASSSAPSLVPQPRSKGTTNQAPPPPQPHVQPAPTLQVAQPQPVVMAMPQQQPVMMVPQPASFQAYPVPSHAPPPGGAPAQQGRGGAGSRQGQRGQSNRQAQQNARRAEQEAQQAAALEAQKRQLESDPEYKAWFEEQQKLQAVGDTARMRVFQNLQQQEALATVERQQQQNQAERLNVAEVLKLVSEHDVTIVCTDTGSGKSTLIPSTLLDTGNPDTRVVATQPRRTATIALAEHVSRLRGEHVGDDVGYWIRGEKKGSEDSTRLWYMTSYTLLLHLLKDPLHPPFTHVILDEFHERQPDIEVTTAILKLCLRHKTSGFKLILMSATLNSEDWESYFEDLSVAVYKQSEPEHQIHDFFMEDVCAITNCQHNKPSGFSPVMVDQMQLENSIFVAQQLVTFLNAVAQSHQSILLFLPGRAQVEHFVMWANNTLRGRVEPIAWHSAVDVSHIQAAINRRGGRAQKLYVATDIAEVSITLPDVVFVIDLGLVKRPLISPSQAASVLYPPLMTQWVSKVNIAQRRGRVGRVQQGFYFCLISAETIKELPDFPASPIQHSRIDELALHSLQVVSNPVALFALCRGQPQLETVSTTMRTLISLGCILSDEDKHAAAESIKEVHDNEEWSRWIMKDASTSVGGEIVGYKTTFIGRLMQLIPVSTQQGMLVFYGFLTGLESLMILAAAVTNSVSPFDVRIASGAHKKGGGRKGGYDSMARAMEHTEATMKETALNLSSDIVSVMGAVLRCMVQCAGHFDDPSFVRIWCEDRNMSYDKTMAIIDLNNHIKYELSGFVPFRDVEDPSVLTTQLEKVAPIVVAATCGAFAAQALEVTIEGNMHHSSKETAIGLFTDLKGMPDLHSPSCIRWELGDVIVPVAVNLRFSHMLVGFATAVKTTKEFYLSLLLFAYRLNYAAFEDDEGGYYEFSVTYSDTTRYIETDAVTGAALVEFRRMCANLCQSMRLQYSNKDLSESEFSEQVLGPRKLAPLIEQQRAITASLVNHFYGAPHSKMDIVEVQHGEADLDQESIFAFAL